jgi:hypothetical protein
MNKQGMVSGASGWHPAGIAAGAAVGSVVGAAIGAVVGGPVGAAVGGALCAATGALFGQTAAEIIKPTAEEMYWMKTSPRAVASSRFDRPDARPEVDPSVRDGSSCLTPSPGTGSSLAVSGLRFPARSFGKKK